MNSAAKITLTGAETALVDSFVDRLGRLPGNAEIVQSRDKAIAALKKNGLPTRRVEAWHYTDLRRLLSSVPVRDHSANAPSVSPLLDGSLIIETNNGRTQHLPSLDDVKVSSVASALQADIGGISLANVDPHDAVGLINSGFVSDGVMMTIPDDQDLQNIIELQNLHDGGQVHTRHEMVFGAGSKGLFIDRHGGSDADVLASNITRLTLREGADITWIRFQDQGNAATHLGRIEVELAADAKLTLFVVNLSGSVVREEIRVKTVGEGADLAFRSVNMLGEKSHCDVTLVLDHAVPNTTSTETVRNVITGKASGVFQGQIKVAQIAQKTDAQMACNTLLLSDDASISVKPELEIFADDVICAHGATVTEIEHDHLFYLMARGISEKTARGLLVKAFVAEIVEELEHDELVAVLEERIDGWLDAHG